MRDTYFALLSGDELLGALEDRVTRYYDYLEASGHRERMNRSLRAYYGADNNRATDSDKISDDSMRLNRTGQVGELVAMVSNHYKSLTRTLVNLVTQQKPTVQCRAINSDYKSQTQALLGNGIVSYEFAEKKITEKSRRALEMALVLSEAWCEVEWDRSGGDPLAIDPNTKRPIYTGDNAANILGPMDVIRDVTAPTFDAARDWRIVRKFVSKWTLAAQHPDHADYITSLSQESDPRTQLAVTYRDKADSDVIECYVFYHRPTPLLPKGRCVVFVRGEIIEDTEMAYERIPLSVCRFEDVPGTSLSWSPIWDLLGLQQALNMTNGIILSNQAAFGVQSVWIGEGSNIAPSDLNGGMRIFQGATEPKAINLTATPAEVYNYRNSLIEELQLISGINATARGNPPAGPESGAALALLVSQATQYANIIEASYIAMIEDVAFLIISNLRRFAKTKRVAYITGNASRAYLKEFAPDELTSINRIVVEPVSALSRSTSGRVEMAQQLMQQNLIKDPQTYITLLETGSLDGLIEGSVSETLLIRAENEKLRNGQDVAAILVDDHVRHLIAHREVLSSPEARDNADLVKLVNAHLQEHINLWGTVPTAILQAMGQQSAPADPNRQQPTGPSPAQITAPPAPMDPAQPAMPQLPANTPPDTQNAYQQVLANNGSAA